MLSMNWSTFPRRHQNNPIPVPPSFCLVVLGTCSNSRSTGYLFTQSGSVQPKYQVQQSQILLFHRICLEMQVLMLSANKDLPYPGNELPSKKGTLSYASPPEFGFNLVLQNLFPCQVKEEMQCEFSSIHRMATDIEEGRDITLKLISIHLQEWQWTLTQASGEEVQNPHIVCPPLKSS